MYSAVITGIAIYLLLKSIAGKMDCMAIIWYYLDSGLEGPTKEDLDKYREKVIKKIFRIKED